MIDGSLTEPPKFFPKFSSNCTTILNLAHVAWFENNHNILIWINSILFESLIPYTIGVTYARELRVILESHLAAASQSHIHELYSRL